MKKLKSFFKLSFRGFKIAFLLVGAIEFLLIMLFYFCSREDTTVVQKWMKTIDNLHPYEFQVEDTLATAEQQKQNFTVHEVWREEVLYTHFTSSSREQYLIKQVFSNAETLRFFGRVKESLAEYKKVLSMLDPKEWLNISVCEIAMAESYRVLDDRQGAQQLYQKNLIRLHGKGQPYLEALSYKGIAQVTRNGAYLTKAYILFQENDHASGSGAVLKIYGDIARNKGILGEAQQFYDRAQQLFLKVDDKFGTASILRSNGHMQRILGNYDLAKKYYTESLNDFHFMNNQGGIARALRGMGDLERDNYCFSKSRQYYDKALTIFHKSGNIKGAAEVQKGLGSLVLLQQNFEVAEKHLDAAYTNFEKLNESLWLNETRLKLGELYYAKREYAKAAEMANNALKAAEKDGDKLGIIISLLLLSKVNRNFLNVDAMFNSLDRAFDTAKLLTLPIYIARTHLYRANIHHYHTNNLYLARLEIDRALELLCPEKHSIYRAFAYRRSAEIYLLEGDGTKAQDHIEKSLSIFKGLQHKEGVCKAYYTLAKISSLFYDAKKSEKYYKKSLKLATDLKHIKYTERNRIGLAQIYEQNGQSDLIESIYLEAGTNALKINDLITYGWAMKSLVQYAIKQGDLVTAEKYCRQGKEKISRLSNVLMPAQFDFHQGRIYQMKGDYQKAIQHYAVAARVFERCHTNFLLIRVLIIQAKLLMKTDPYKATEYLLKAKYLAENYSVSSHYTFLVEINILLAEKEMLLGDFVASKAHLETLLPLVQMLHTDGELLTAYYRIVSICWAQLENSAETQKALMMRLKHSQKTKSFLTELCTRIGLSIFNIRKGSTLEIEKELQFLQKHLDKMGVAELSARLKNAIGEYAFSQGKGLKAINQLQAAKAFFVKGNLVEKTLKCNLKLAQVYLKLGRKKDAQNIMTELKKSLVHNAFRAKTYYALACLSEDLGDREQAILYWEEAFNTASQSHNLMIQAKAHQKLADYNPKQYGAEMNSAAEKMHKLQKEFSNIFASIQGARQNLEKIVC